ncbi:hypothetical protein EDD90_7114 [Streptomyces sp. Ag109_O5-1]|uniref:hypothetical protein n=1 Tax=Streptomyces sp. Ag109_O5-1 TaxID=1938851 RepID=UPI000F505F6E|nr:hypothetical protein [Streptomyces sp. Ag109_O5-1]RPE43896.1 hypothetical protein EDD90_7114 [Streptomyces sp. Ag109_O5-1]
MTAEHENNAGGPGNAVGPGEVDALLAVLMDEPLSAEQRADPAFMAEHRAATADVALLREQLGIIGATLAGPPPAAVRPRPHPGPRPRPAGRRRPWQHPGVRAVGLAGALAAAFASVVLGIGWLAANGGSSSMSNGSADKAAAGGRASDAESAGGPGYLACARLVVEGTVTGVHRIPHTGEERVTLKVTRAYKPAKTAAEVDVLFESGADDRIRAGARLLVGVTAGQQIPDRYAVGESDIAPERARIVHDLPESRTLTCRK